MIGTILLSIYLIGLGLSLAVVWLCAGWTLGTRHDDGFLLVSSVACFAWFVIVGIFLFDAWASRVERKRAVREFGL